MPILYGEGASKAFRRLQNKIMQTSFDQTIFAWRAKYPSSGLLAAFLSDFIDTPPLALWGPNDLSPYVMTNVGLSIKLNMVEIEDEADKNARPSEHGKVYLAALQCDVKIKGSWEILLVFLEPVSTGQFSVNGIVRRAFRRIRCDKWLHISTTDLFGSIFEDILVLQDEHNELFERSIEDNFERYGVSPFRPPQAPLHNLHDGAYHRYPL